MIISALVVGLWSWLLVRKVGYRSKLEAAVLFVAAYIVMLVLTSVIALVVLAVTQ